MLSRHERALQIMAQLHAELPSALDIAMQIALRHSLSATAMVTELESIGYRVSLECFYRLTSIEQSFDESLDEADRNFLREPLPADLDSCASAEGDESGPLP